MTKDELLKNLEDLVVLSEQNAKEAHILADRLLLEFIEDMDVAEAFEKIHKYYNANSEAQQRKIDHWKAEALSEYCRGKLWSKCPKHGLNLDNDE